MKSRFLIALALSALPFVACSRGAAPDEANELKVSGTVEATEARLGFQAGGRIEEIRVREGDRVRKGDLLARVDNAELQAKRQQAIARIESVRALLLELENGSRDEEIGQAGAVEGAAEARAIDARRDLERSRTLYEGGAISLEVYQKSQAAAAVAEKQLQQTREQLSLVRKGPRTERIAAQRAQLREAEAALAAVDAVAANLQIVSPLDGIVSQRHREPNEVVAPGQPVLTLMNPADRWVRVFVPEPRLNRVRVGASASIISDGDPSKKHGGRVTWISQEAEFTPKNVQTTEERVKLVYAVKVGIDGDAAMELKPGLPVDVTIALQ